MIEKQPLSPVGLVVEWSLAQGILLNIFPEG